MNFLPSNKRSGYLLLAVLAIVCSALLIVLPRNSQASSQMLVANSNGKIAFTSDFFLYTVNANGG